MRIWYDACTGKHIRYGAAIAKMFRELGHEVVLTTRKHPDTVNLAQLLGEEPAIVGIYNPSSLYARLKNSAQRTLQLLEFFKNNPPDLAISHQSVELCRVAFGMKIPILLTADTPHAEAVNRLTIPLADTLVASKAIPQKIFKRYGATKIVQYDGVDEVAWIQNFKPTRKYDFPHPLIVVRQLESQAAYALGRTDITQKLAKKLTKLGNVLFITRYSKAKTKGLLSTKEFLDTATLVSEADIVISIGGTIAREAALQGTPSIVLTEFGQTYVNKYLAKMGFPLFIVPPSKVIAVTKKYMSQKWDVKSKLATMENPLDVIRRISEEKFAKNVKESISNST